MRVIITAPTVFEIAPIIKTLDTYGRKISFSKYTYKGCEIETLVTGIGSVKTAVAMSQINTMKKVDLAIQVGLAGTYDPNISIGSIVLVERDRHGDLGVEEQDGSFTTIETLGIEDNNLYPYVDGWILHNLKVDVSQHTHVSAITVNTVSGTLSTINKRKALFEPQIETMEGAGFYYSCRVLDIPCIQLRAISNTVEPRNKNNWQIERAIENLEQEFVRIFPTLVQQDPKG